MLKTRVSHAVRPIGKALNERRAQAPVCLHEHSLEGMDAPSAIVALGLWVPRPQWLTKRRRVVALGGLVRREQRVDLLPRADYDARRRDLPHHGVLPAGEALRKALLDPVGAARLVVFWAREVVGVREERLHPLVVARAGWGRAEEEGEALAVGGPDHGLHVRRRPAVKRDADELIKELQNQPRVTLLLQGKYRQTVGGDETGETESSSVLLPRS